MLKSLLLSSVRPFYDAEKEGGTAEKTEKEKQREAVNMSDTTTNDDKEEEKEEEIVEETKDDGEDEEPEEKEEEDETKELTAEQKENEKLKKTIERLQRRVGKTTGEKAQITRELEQAKASLEAKVADGTGLTEEEVERRATAKAQDIALDTEFKRAQTKLINQAKKSDPDFLTKVNDMAQEIAPIPSQMIGILDDIDNGGAVLAYLANNVDEYEEIFNQPLAKMTRQLDKLSQKLEEEAKPKKKPISKVPAPNEPIKGNERSPMVLTGKESMDNFVRIRAQQVEERRKAKMR